MSCERDRGGEGRAVNEGREGCSRGAQEGVDHLLRSEAIRSNQKQSEAIRSNQKQSEEGDDHLLRNELLLLLLLPLARLLCL